MYAITIDPALNGFVVHVGCQTLVFGGPLGSSVEHTIATYRTWMLQELRRYLEAPGAMKQAYLKLGQGLATAVSAPMSPPKAPAQQAADQHQGIGIEQLLRCPGFSDKVP